jgi:hypothetical protein
MYRVSLAGAHRFFHTRREALACLRDPYWAGGFLSVFSPAKGGEGYWRELDADLAKARENAREEEMRAEGYEVDE